MELSLNQAAKQGKVAKTTLQRALKSGECSGSKTENGQWKIESSELMRWAQTYSKKPRQNQQENQLDHSIGTHKKPPTTSALEKEVEVLRERIDDKDDTIQDLRERLDGETAERKKLTALLTDQREKSMQQATEPPKSLWRRIFDR